MRLKDLSTPPVDQFIYSTDVNIFKTRIVLETSKEIKYLDDTEKGLLTFGLKKFPEAKLQLSPAGTLNIYCHIKDIRGILSVLTEHLVTEECKPASLHPKSQRGQIENNIKETRVEVKIDWWSVGNSVLVRLDIKNQIWNQIGAITVRPGMPTVNVPLSTS